MKLVMIGYEEFLPIQLFLGSTFFSCCSEESVEAFCLQYLQACFLLLQLFAIIGGSLQVRSQVETIKDNYN